MIANLQSHMGRLLQRKLQNVRNGVTGGLIRGKIMRRSIIASVFFVLTGNQALACSCGEQTFDEAFRGAELIFEGEFISAAPVAGEDVQFPDQTAAYTILTEPESLSGKFKVTREIKGVGQEFRFVRFTKAEGGNCGASFNPGEVYRVFADRLGGHYFTSACHYTFQESFLTGGYRAPSDENAAFDAICKAETDFDKRRFKYLIEAIAKWRYDERAIESYLSQFRGINEAGVDRKIAAARTADEFRDYERAISLWQSVVDEDTGDIRGQIGLGKVKRELGD